MYWSVAGFVQISRWTQPGEDVFVVQDADNSAALPINANNAEIILAVRRRPVIKGTCFILSTRDPWNKKGVDTELLKVFFLKTDDLLGPVCVRRAVRGYRNPRDFNLPRIAGIWRQTEMNLRKRDSELLDLTGHGQHCGRVQRLLHSGLAKYVRY